MKKRGKISSKKNVNSPLSGAIKDLQAEIAKLSKEKGALKSELSRTGSAIDSDRDKQKRLQQRIASLIEKEAKLNQQKKTLQTKIDRVADKVNKISKIKSEMSDV